MEALLIGLVVVVVGVVALLALDFFTGRDVEAVVKVLDKSWTPATVSTGVSVSPKGGVSPVITAHGAEYELAVEFEDGTRGMVDTDEDSMLYVEIGQRITISQRIGGIFGIESGWSYESEDVA